MKVITYHVELNTLKFWEVKNVDKFKKSIQINRPETKNKLDFYQVVDFTRGIKGSEFEIARNEIITYSQVEKEEEVDSEILPWYKHSEITRSFLYSLEENTKISHILDNYSRRTWWEIETGIIPKPDNYPIIPAKARKVINYINEKKELQRIRVKEL